MEENKTSTIGKEFTMLELSRFIAPPVLTRLLVSFLSTLDDSLFVSRYLGANALAAFSVAMPWFMFVDAIGMMVSAISVICSNRMGRKLHEEAKSDFTTMSLVTFGIGSILTIILALFSKEILIMLGETKLLLPFAQEYFTVSKFYVPLILVNYIFNSFYVIAGKPKYSMYASGINIFCQLFFDYLFIARLGIGIVGAAYANLIGNLTLTIFAIIFYSNKQREICFTKPVSDVWPLLKEVIKYGRIQAVTSLAVSLSSYINNRVQLSIGGEMIVAAYTIVANVTFMFMNSFFALIGSTSPIASYAFGERNPKKLSRIIRQTVVLIGVLMLFIFAIIFFGKDLIIDLYLNKSGSDNLRNLVNYGFRVYPLSLIFFGYNVYVQEILNVFGRHKVSLFLSILENVIFQNSATIILPRLFGVNAVWYAFLCAEILTIFFSAYFVYRYKDVYGYGSSGTASFVDNKKASP